MLTKKNYIEIAKCIRSIHELTKGEKDNTMPVERVTQILADYFKQDNPNFNRQKFIDACYLANIKEGLNAQADHEMTTDQTGA
jgi:Ca2+-binding EF-hand superfamily protein